MRGVIEPRRIIFYLVDGVSGAKIRSFNSDDENTERNADMPETFFDDIFKDSYAFTRGYGFDTTQGSTFALFSGQSHHETPLSIAPSGVLLKIKRSIFEILKEKGYKTHFHTNITRKRHRGIPFKGFDAIKAEPLTYLLKDTKLPDSFFGKDGSKTCLFIHDLFTHDLGGLSAKGKYHLTSKQYSEFIVKNADNVKKNLEFLQFDPDKDLLVLFSDHGLTVDSLMIPGMKMIFAKERGELWSLPGKELKSRVFFMVRHNAISPGVNNGVCTLLEQFDYVMKQLGVDDYLSPEYSKFNFNKEAITFNFGIFPFTYWGIIKKRIFNNRFYQFIYVKGEGEDRDKWIYQIDLKKGEYFNLKEDPMEENPRSVGYDELPDKMKSYITSYNRSKRLNWRMFAAQMMKLWIDKIEDPARVRYNKMFLKQ